MTMKTPGSGPRVEAVVQVLILLTIGGVAAAASFTHVHNVAAAHGQPGWLAWSDAIVLELMSIATGLEIRRRARTGRPAGFVLAVLIAAVVLSLAAQVVEAERSIVGWLAAALPALGFLACVKIVLARAAGTADESTQTAEEVGAVLPVPAPVPVVPSAEPDVPPVADEDDQSPAGLLDRARTVAAEHRRATGREITRDQLRTALRTSNATASELLRQLREPGRTDIAPVPPSTFTRLNGTGGQPEVSR